jgi:hypothetical protein
MLYQAEEFLPCNDKDIEFSSCHLRIRWSWITPPFFPFQVPNLLDLSDVILLVFVASSHGSDCGKRAHRKGRLRK